MASWFRSEKMKYVQLIIPEDAAHNCVSVLGSMGVIQFTDLNTDQTAFQRRYVSYIARCDELERKLRYFKSEIEKFGISVQEIGTPEDFARSTGSREKGPKLLEVLESDLEKKEAELLELNKFSETLNIEFNQKAILLALKVRSCFAVETPYMTSHTFRKFWKVQRSSTRVYAGTGVQNATHISVQIKCTNNTIARPTGRGRRTMLFRATLQLLLRFAEIEAPIGAPPTGEMMHKMVFMVFFKSSAIEAKINKICDVTGAARHGCRRWATRAPARLEEETGVELKEAQKVLHKNRHARYALCCRLAQELEEWQWTVLREKSTYHTLNLFKVFNRGFLSGGGLGGGGSATAQVEGAVVPAPGVDTEMTTVVEDAQALAHPAHLLRTEFDIHVGLPGVREHVRHPAVPGGQPRALHRRHLPLHVRRDVRGHWPRRLRAAAGAVPALAGQPPAGPRRRRPRLPGQGPVHDLPDGPVLGVLRAGVQRLLRAGAGPVRVQVVRVHGGLGHLRLGHQRGRLRRPRLGVPVWV
ncbi:unnamed protein product [Heterosigma akashiwo]